MKAECCRETYDLRGCVRCKAARHDARSDVCPKCGRLLFPEYADSGRIRKQIRNERHDVRRDVLYLRHILNVRMKHGRKEPWE